MSFLLGGSASEHLTARALGPTSRSTKRQPQSTSSRMAAIIPFHSHYYTHESPRSPPIQPSTVSRETKPPTQQRSHYDRPVTHVQSATMSGTPNQGPGLRYPSNKKSIYDRNLNRSKNAELSRAAFAYLFIEMIAYAQRGVSNVGDLEQKYACVEVNDTWTYADYITDSTRKATQSAYDSSTSSSRVPPIHSQAYDRLESSHSSSSSRKHYIDTSSGGPPMHWKSRVLNRGSTCSSTTNPWSTSTYHYRGSSVA